MLRSDADTWQVRRKEEQRGVSLGHQSLASRSADYCSFSDTGCSIKRLVVIGPLNQQTLC